MSSPLAVIVGTGPGIGLAVARRFAREGFDLALLARNADRLAGWKEELSGLGTSVQAYPCDASEPLGIAKVFQDLRDGQGAPRVMVYNASVLKEAPPSKLSHEAFLREFRTNCTGALVCAQEVIPGMLAAGRGTLLFTGGGLALKPHFPLASLSIGKGAMRTLALMLAEELEPRGIHAATVTVDGFVQAGTRLEPDGIANEYWKLHKEPAGNWTRELVLR